MKMRYQSFLLAAGSFLLQTYGTEVDEEGLVIEHFTVLTPNPTGSPKSEVCMQIYFWLSLVWSLTYSSICGLQVGETMGTLLSSFRLSIPQSTPFFHPANRLSGRGMHGKVRLIVNLILSR